MCSRRSTLVLLVLSALLILDASSAFGRVRQTYFDLSPDDRQKFVNALLALKAVDPGGTNSLFLDGYDDFVNEHTRASQVDPGCHCFIDPNVPSVGHAGPAFVAWHRIFLLELEDALRSVNGGEFSDVTIPYWDWTKDPFPSDLVQDSGDNNFMGGNGNPIVTTGPFRAGTGDWPVVGGLQRDFFPGFSSFLPTPQDVEDAIDITYFDAFPWNRNSLGFRNELESGGANGMHNSVHWLIGGHMRFTSTATNDPIFFMHHANIDRIACKWQVEHPLTFHHLPAGGVNHPMGLQPETFFGQNAFDPMLPWSSVDSSEKFFAFMPVDTVNVAALGYEYDDCQGPCVNTGAFEGQTTSEVMLREQICIADPCEFQLVAAQSGGGGGTCNFSGCLDGSSPGLCGCGQTSQESIDTDGDTIPDCIDICPGADDLAVEEAPGSYVAICPRALTKDEQKCANTLNKNFAKVAKAQGKVICSCLKDGAKNKLPGSIEDCLLTDPKGKVGKATGKAVSDADKRCSPRPLNPADAAFGPTDPGLASFVALQKELDLVHDIFGSDLDAVIATESNDKAQSKCQQAVMKLVKKCQGAKLKEFNKCKKSGLKAETIQSFRDLQDGCLGVGSLGIPDNGGKIQKACGAKILSIVNKKCGAPIDTSTAFPGCGTSDPATLAACLDQKIECRVCLALNLVDNIGRDCDEFDDGVVNESCP